MSLHPNEVLLSPVVSEKSYSLIEDRKYSLRVHQDASLYRLAIGNRVEVLHRVRMDRHVWIQVASGALRAKGHELGAGDGLAVSDEELVAIEGRSEEPAEALLFDLA